MNAFHEETLPGKENDMQVNGKNVPLEREMTLLELLHLQGYENLHRIAVERNEEIVEKKSYGEIMLQDSDVIEIVQFMGGGAY